MASVNTGVVLAADVNMPSNGGPPNKWLDLDSPATWSTIWFVVALVVLLTIIRAR